MGALSGNRLRAELDCCRYRSRQVDALNARLPDRTPPRRGKRVEPSCTDHLAQSAAIRLFVAVRPAGSDEGASSHQARQPPDPALGRFSVRRSGPALRLEGGLSVNRAPSVSALRQTSAINRVRPPPCDRGSRLPGHPLLRFCQVVPVDGSHRHAGDVTSCRLRFWRRLDRRLVRQPFAADHG